MGHPNPPAQVNTPVSVVPDTSQRQETIPATVNPDSRSGGNVIDTTPKFIEPKVTEPTKAEEPKQKTPENGQSQPNSQQPTDTVEMDRFKAVQKIARENEDDARAYRKMLQALGVQPDQKAEFDPQAAYEKLQRDFNEERTARARENVSHTTGVPVDQIHGSTPEEMQASAQRALDWLNGKLQQANTPVTAPASVVNSPAGPNDGGPQQIQTREELARMSPADRMKAVREGRCDTLLGKR